MSWLAASHTGKRTSKVWEHFKMSSERTCTKCNYCDAVLTFHRSTSTMRHHLKALHRDVRSVQKLISADKLSQRKRTARMVSSAVLSACHQRQARDGTGNTSVCFRDGSIRDFVDQGSVSNFQVTLHVVLFVRYIYGTVHS